MPQATDRPQKPSPEFPLFPHRNGHWAKKIKGKAEYFGKWADDREGKRAKRYYDAFVAGKPEPPEDTGLYLHKSGQYAKTMGGRTRYFGDNIIGATEKFAAEKRRQTEGYDPRVAEKDRLGWMVAEYLKVKKADRDRGAISGGTFEQYRKTCEKVLKHFGHAAVVKDFKPADYEGMVDLLAEKVRGGTKGKTSLKNEIIRVRTFFNFCFENDMIVVPAKYGSYLKLPSKREIRVEQIDNPKIALTQRQLLDVLAMAKTPFKAMVLLAINAGIGPKDIALMQYAHLDLERGWVDYRRRKTGNDRRFPLWPETLEAIKDAIATRPQGEAAEFKDYIFLTKQRNVWYSDTRNPISQEMRKLLKKIGVTDQNTGFYTLRSMFQTIAEGTKDKYAVKFVMGHMNGDDDMRDFYNLGIGEDRLQAVVDYVRHWLFGKNSSKAEDVSSDSDAA